VGKGIAGDLRMNIRFFEPPPVQKIGGLDAAITSLGAAMKQAGHSVAVNEALPANSAGTAVHFHGLWQRNFPALARECRRRGIPYVVSPHGMLEPWARRKKWWKKWPYFQLIEKRWIAGSACVLATAKPEADRLAEFFLRNRIESLPLGLTADRRPDYAAARARLGWNADETVLLFLSRIHEKKGLDLLLTALAELHGKVPLTARLVIVGPEEQPVYAAHCRDFIARNAQRLPRTEWIGAVWGEDRWSYFQGADLFCLPTHSENFGLAVLEACQVGTPALTTTETPWADALTAGRGFIARPEVADIRARLAQFFSAALSTTDERAALAEWAWANYDWAKLAPRYAALYESLC
jgi:glycosyltransferase involved in cell wall biosynthesis